MKLTRRSKRLITRLRLPKFIRSKWTISDKNFENVWTLGVGKIAIVDGYFENLRQLDLQIQAIRKIYRYRVRYSSEAPVLNFRGGEYVRQGLNKNSDVKKYKDFIEYHGLCEYLVITDDFDFAREQLSLLNVQHYSFLPKDIVVHFSTLVQSEAKILSHSTFSHWSYYLSRDVKKVKCLWME